MNFLYPVYTELTECQDCYKCVRQCPVKAIRVENGHAMIIPEMCIVCGTCVIKCPAKAKRVRSDLQRLPRLLSLKQTVIVSLAPSFVSEFPDCTSEQLVEAIKMLGFTGVSETAIGADLVSARVAEDLCLSAAGKTDQKLFLSSACPVVVEYIKHFMPDFTPFITDRSSPLLAHARFLRETYGDDIGVVFIGPCIAKKRESDIFRQIDLAITFDELRRRFNEEGIQPSKIPSGQSGDTAFIPFRSAKGAFFPIDGGMIKAVKQYHIPDSVHSLAVTGIDEIPSALAGLHNESLEYPLFIELLSCTGGCINGPASSKKRSGAIKHVNVVDYAQSAKDRLDESVVKEKFDLSGTLPAKRVYPGSPDESAIREALRSVGKYTGEDEVNCASCGYDTCREFAKAMLENRAEKTMCVSYMRKLAQKKANGLIQTIPSGVIICDKDLRIIECNKNFARLMGTDIEEMYEAKPGLEGADLTRIADFFRFFEDVLAKNGPDVIEREVRTGKKIYHVTVFAIEKEACAGGVVEDITAPQIQKDRIVNQARKVITKHLSVVQKIAFLMGENAAETESMLNSIINSFSDESEQQ
ncbi:[Fe-Fe] hydrogenase large subunit C-terminal domain-containing protein [Treponema sp. HNW]|uniref:[Fe-Fe] hydrogenase large subunit C-terminal domain-containing protein n=1 Tax=Treponema sp. HNW TaxID=3116654 RepID=UPI003D114DCA